MRDEYALGDRWVCSDGRVWEKKDWGWKFIGIARSTSILDVFDLKSTNADHPWDVFVEEKDGGMD